MAMGAAGAAQAVVDDAVVIEPSLNAEPAPVGTKPSGGAAARADALSALVNLGYGQGEAASAIAEAMVDGADGDAQTLIRTCLRLLAPKG